MRDVCALSGKRGSLPVRVGKWLVVMLRTPREPQAGRVAERAFVLTRPEDTTARTVVLAGVPAPLGGVRWWFVCPECGQRRAALYATLLTQMRVRCRVCARLAYAVQLCGTTARLEHRMRRLARRMGDRFPNTLPDIPPKPRGMHWRTYERLANTFVAVEARRDELFFGAIDRFLDRHSPTWRIGT